MTIALIVILVILVLYVIITYNKFVTLKKQMNNSYSVIDVYLKEIWFNTKFSRSNERLC